MSNFGNGFGSRNCWLVVGGFVLATLGAGPAVAEVQLLRLVPGWNSVWLEVEPEDGDPGVVFEGLGIEEVWCYFPTESVVEYIADPEEGLWNVPAWSVYLPENHPEAFLSKLKRVQANRPYLIKLGGTEEKLLSVSGSSTHGRFEWRPNSFNLVGFRVMPGTGGGSYRSFFLPSEAHQSGEVYQLGDDGRWVKKSENPIDDPIEAGVAYWVFASAASDYTGPLEIDVGADGELDFGAVLEQERMVLRNRSPWPQTVRLENRDGFPLLEERLAESGLTEWVPVDVLEVNVPAQSSTTVPLGVRRRGLGGETTGVLAVTVTNGVMRYTVPMRVTVPDGLIAAGQPMQGLWVGTATVDKVGGARDHLGAEPVTASSALSQRLMLHVADDAGGTVRLLKSVIMLWRNGTPRAVTDESGRVYYDEFEPELPGGYVLLTDDRLLPSFEGAEMRDGRAFGYRISAVTYDFEGDSLALDGTFGGDGSELSGAIVLAKDHPTNPYRHAFHPDHDGLTPGYEPQPAGLSADAQETWGIRRELALKFDDVDDDGSPGGGYDVVSGEYRERLFLLREGVPIEMGGRFELKRVSEIGELNPEEL